MLKVGDRVFCTAEVGTSGWHGWAGEVCTVTTPSYSDQTEDSTGVFAKNPAGSTGFLRKEYYIPLPQGEITVDLLRSVVSALRAQGMKITVQVEKTITEEI